MIEEFNTANGIIKQINEYADRYGKEVLTWPVYLEQCSKEDAEYKRTKQDWNIKKVIDFPGEEPDEYFEMLGGVGINYKEKFIIISVNY